ncbi:hypothetical protein BOTCAL_0099g00290 [Botryotinia calthae]|uniref:Uncharacterized protein n=1 Tax=Botryotinia calthae TaxID=38488 RepID=A0A4Y8D6E7_9HELO|nr:hypothetical protein BOTCAL_0099g00290 [Botryotinia calthae]
MDPLSLSASISGLISIVKDLSGTTYKYIKTSKGAPEEVKQLAEQMTHLFGILNSLSLVASRFDNELRTATMQLQHLSTCQQLLDKIQIRLDKADPNNFDQTKTRSGQKLYKLRKSLTWPFTTGETKELITAMASQKSDLSLALQADGMNALLDALGNQRIQMAILDDINANMLAEKKERTLRAMNKQQKKMIQWISPHDPSQKYHEVAEKLRHPKSGQWFLTCEPFKEWLASKGSKLWLYGIPGAGKTVLSSSIVTFIATKLHGSQDDEYECGNERSKVVELLAQLVTDEHTNIRVILTSREEVDIERYLKYFKKMSIAADKSDLRLYVHSELARRLKDESLILINKSLKQEIAHRLVNDAEGMFRWVVCQFDHLCELNSDKAIREALQSLPPTLFETYERILDRVNSKSSDTKRLVRRVLAWTVCSPGPLSTKELLEAIAINTNDSTLDRDSMTSEKHILRWCSSLVMSTGKAGETQIELAHFTVKEFLLLKAKPQSDDIYAEYRISEKLHYPHLAKICLTYLLFDDFEKLGICNTQEAMDQRDEQHPFYWYASEYFHEYAIAHQNDDKVFCLLKTLFDPAKTNNFLCWSQKFMSNELFSDENIKDISNSTTLHFAALLSLDRVCLWLVESSEFQVNVNKISGIGTPIACTLAPQLMLRFDKSIYIDQSQVNDSRYKVLECLLKSDLIINNVRIDPRRNWSPLAMAVNANFGWDLLLEEGAIIDDTCMSELERIGYEETKLVPRFVKKVTDSNISIDVKSRFVELTLKQEETSHRGLELISKSNVMNNLSRREVTLQKASLYGQTQIVKDILAQGDLEINFCAPETDYLTALHSASMNGHIDVVRLLVDHGAALEVKDSRSNSSTGFLHLTAYMLALLNGHIEVVILLENSGANINSLDSRGHSTLHIAATHSVSMIEYILHSPRFHQTVSVRSAENVTIFMIAVIGGDMDIIEYVLERSSLSDILARRTSSDNSSDFNGFTALHFAVYFDSPRDVVEKLIQSGLETSMETEHGNTPLNIAADCGNLELFRAVIINLEPKDAEGRSPLVVLCQQLARSHKTHRWEDWTTLHNSMDLLIRRGADILSQDARGNTALHYICKVASIPHHFGALLVLLYESTPILLCSKTSEHYIESYDCETLDAQLYKVSPLVSTLSDELCLPLELQRRQSSGKFSNAALLNLVDNNNQTALHVIFNMLDVEEKSHHIEKFALELLTFATKEDINRVLPDGRSLLNISFSRGYGAISQKLIDMDIDVKAHGNIYGANSSTLELLCELSSDNQELIRSMISGQKPEALYGGETLIHIACFYGSIAVIEELLSAGWSTETTNKHGYTPIVSAIQGSEESTLELLLAHGAHLSNVMYRFGKLDEPYNPLSFAESATICRLIDSKGVSDWLPEALEDKKKIFIGVWVPGITSNPNEPDSYSGKWETKRISSLSVLHLAAYNGYIEVLEFGISQKRLNVNARASLGLTPLFFAIFGNEKGAVELLLQHGADANEYYGPIQVTPLHVAVAVKNVSIIKMLMSHRVNAHSADATGWTPHMAARLRHKSDKMVEALGNSPSPASPHQRAVEENEEILGTDERIHIALERAILCNDVENVKALSKNGWSPESTCSCGCTILLAVLHDGLLELANYFVDADVTVEGTIAESCASTTVTGFFPPKIPQRRRKSHKFLKGSTSLDLATSLGDSKLVQKILDRSQPSSPHILRSLHTALMNCDTECIGILLHRLAVQSRNGNCLEAEHTLITHPEYVSAPLFSPGHNGSRKIRRKLLINTALHLAAKSSNDSFRVINELLVCGADLEARNNYGETPLHLALLRTNLKSAVTLTFAGANVNSLSGNKHSPIQLAVAYCTPDIVFLLHKFGASLETDRYNRGDLLLLAIQKSNPEMVHALKKFGVDLNMADHTGVPVLLTALEFAEEDFILKILPEIDVIQHPKLGTTLNQASFQGLLKIVSALLNREFKIQGGIKEYVNHAGRDGAPLYLAAIGNNFTSRVECMELLIRHGAEVNLVSGPQGTPLIAACYHGAYDSVVYLLKHGANTACKKLDGIETTAIQAAHLHKDIMLLLQNFQQNGPRALDEPRTIMNANIPMLEWCMLRLENDEKKAERADQLSLFESASSQPWWAEDIDTDEDQESSHHEDEIPELKHTDDRSL